jgi:hypothetical protein
MTIEVIEPCPESKLPPLDVRQLAEALAPQVLSFGAVLHVQWREPDQQCDVEVWHIFAKHRDGSKVCVFCGTRISGEMGGTLTSPEAAEATRVILPHSCRKCAQIVMGREIQEPS